MKVVNTTVIGMGYENIDLGLFSVVVCYFDIMQETVIVDGDIEIYVVHEPQRVVVHVHVN